jgi:hypothetical protein
MALFARPLEMTFGSEKVTVIYGCPPNSCLVPDNADLIFRKYGSLLGEKRICFTNQRVNGKIKHLFNEKVWDME